jgi:hypothetical protein
MTYTRKSLMIRIPFLNLIAMPAIRALSSGSKADINRDLCKAAVMTTPYRITERGMIVQLFETDLTEPFHVPRLRLNPL